MRVYLAVPGQGQRRIPGCLDKVYGDPGFLLPQLPVVNDDAVGFALFVGVLKRNTVN